ncbi:MAG: hypothetical protein PHS80_01880 [Methanothrix sp.]|nr:hypothetical protein [Methanothrix sp.]MDD4448090.1 hypothetical protein [Methanothrix sp.]
MRWILFLMLSIMACIAANMAYVNAVDLTDDRLAQNFTEHSWIFVNGYMEESRILQTDTGFKGQKMALTTSGSGMATRTIDSEVYRDSNREEASLTISANYDYAPYVPPLTQSDLRNALCAKNYEVGSVYSETYNIDKDLIKDTKIYQNDSFSVYEISSEIQGTARIGQRVQKNAKTVPSFMMAGTYMGYAQIRSETIVGNTSVLTLPCP